MVVDVPVPVPVQNGLTARRLEQVFSRCFSKSLRTRLQGGAEEPLYQPARNQQDWHRLYYRADYFASALHEVSHWCIAGAQRRQQLDFGYWYAPDGRDQGQQKTFEAVEYKPQALEWFFSKACGYGFRISVDNLDPETGRLPDTRCFRQRVHKQVLYWQQEGLPERALRFFLGLCDEFGTSVAAQDLHFALAELD
jgi:elongation factor P hydroxylase